MFHFQLPMIMKGRWCMSWNYWQTQLICSDVDIHGQEIFTVSWGYLIFLRAYLAGIYPWLKRLKQAKPVLLIVTWLLKLTYKLIKLETSSSRINLIMNSKVLIMHYHAYSINEQSGSRVFLTMAICNKLFLMRNFSQSLWVYTYANVGEEVLGRHERMKSQSW